MNKPSAEIESCRSAHVRLATLVGSVTDTELRRPSLLPSWTVAHVLAHLARNAEAMVRRIEAAQRNEMSEQYVGGAKGRAAAIEAGSELPADELIADALTWSQRLDLAFASVPDDSWDLPVRTVSGTVHPVSQLPFRRWREVEVHLVDLDLGVSPADWPQGLVDVALPRLIAGLADRAAGRALMSWILGRGAPPALEPWG